MPIPLLRLPLLVFEAITKNMEPRQLVILSLCSKRTRLAVKHGRSKATKMELKLTVDYEIKIRTWCGITESLGLHIREMPEEPTARWTTDIFGAALFRECSRKLYTYWEDTEDGARRLIEYVSDLFCASIKDVTIGKRRFFWLLDFVEQRQGPRSYKAKVDYMRDPPTDEQFRHLLVNLNPSQLSINTEPSEEFRIEDFRKSYDRLIVSGRGWMTSENLYTLDCEQCYLTNTKFSAVEINRFFRHVLIEGGAPRLTNFRCLVENGDDNGILDGIREVLAPIPGEQQFENADDAWIYMGLFNRGGRSMSVGILFIRFWPTIFLAVDRDASSKHFKLLSRYMRQSYQELIDVPHHFYRR